MVINVLQSLLHQPWREISLIWVGIGVVTIKNKNVSGNAVYLKVVFLRFFRLFSPYMSNSCLGDLLLVG